MLKPTPPPSKWPYVLAAMGGVSLGVIAILVVTIARPEKDNTQLITTIVGMLMPTVAALLALVKGSENTQAVQELKLDVNGRLTQLLERTAQAEHAAGLVLGREQGEAKAVTQAAAIAEAAQKATEAAAHVTQVAVKVAEVAAVLPPIVPPSAGEEVVTSEEGEG